MILKHLHGVYSISMSTALEKEPIYESILLFAGSHIKQRGCVQSFWF